MRTSLMIWASMVVLMVVGAGCYEVVYTAEYKGASCIKFEDAMYEVEPDVWVEACLGEDGAVEADLFYVELDGSPEAIEVSVKAGKCNETVTLSGDNDWTAVACAFTISASPYEDGWILAVQSDDIEGGKGGTAALSNVTFCFGDGVTVTSPEEGDVPTLRAEEEEDLLD